MCSAEPGRVRSLDVVRLGRSWAALCAALCVLSGARARAESGPPLDAATTCVEADPLIDPPAGPIPANWPVFTVGLSGNIVATTTSMTRVRDGAHVPLVFGEADSAIPPGRFSFIPASPLDEGESYLVELPHCTGEPTQTFVYDAVAPIPAPSSAGTLSVRGPFAANLDGARGACHRTYFFAVDYVPDQRGLR